MKSLRKDFQCGEGLQEDILANYTCANFFKFIQATKKAINFAKEEEKQKIHQAVANYYKKN